MADIIGVREDRQGSKHRWRCAVIFSWHGHNKDGESLSLIVGGKGGRQWKGEKGMRDRRETREGVVVPKGRFLFF